MKSQTCCFTGHRNIPQEYVSMIERQIEQTVRQLVDRGVIYYGVGGALGFDTLAAKCILRLKTEFPQIKLILVLPCKTQADKWRTEDQRVYYEILEKADKHTYVSDKYTKDCMFKRNRHLVDWSSICVCYLTKQTGGTAYTVNYASEKGLEIINLAP